MAISKCAKCGGSTFEIKEVSPTNGRFKHNFIQCSSCGAPAGAVDYTNMGVEMQTLKGQVAELSSKLDDLESTLRRIRDKLNA